MVRYQIPVNDTCSLSFPVLTGAPLVTPLVHCSPSVTVARTLPRFLPAGACCYYLVQAPVLTLGTKKKTQFIHAHM